MKDIFKSKSNAKIGPFDIIVNARKTIKFGNSLRSKNMESITNSNQQRNFFIKI